MADSFEPDADLTEIICSQKAKHDSPILSTEAGMQIDRNDIHQQSMLLFNSRT
jgi:hypothetical protein